MAQGVHRDVPGEHGFLGRGSGAWQDSPARLSHNAPLASECSPGVREPGEPPCHPVPAFRHEGPDAASRNRRDASQHVQTARPLKQRVLCEGYGFALPVPRRRGAYQGCWFWLGRGAVMFGLLGGRVRRGPSPGGWRAGVRPADWPERQEVGLILGAL